MKAIVISTPIFKFGLTGTFGYSGLEHLAWQTAEGLAKLGHEVFLVAPDGSECPGVSIVPIGPERQVDERMAYAKYWQLLPNCDVVIDHSWQKYSYMLKAEGVLKAPVLGVLHAPVNTMYQSLPPVEKPCIVCISEDQKNHFEALFDRPARRCWNGIDIEFYKSTGAKRTDRFLFLARFSSVKSPHLAIEACKAAGVGLDLVGDTSITAEPEYLAKCQAMADGEQIRFVGSATRGECVHWYSQAHCLVHPVRDFREPFGLAPVEAMSCGCPVIAWNKGAMKETVAPDWLVDSFDQLVEKIKREVVCERYEKDRDNLRAWAGQWSVERMVKRYEELAKEAIEGGW